MPHESLSDEQVIRSFACYQGPKQDGYLIDFLGTRTRVEYLAGVENIRAGVEGYPLPGNFHATTLEWAGSLRAVLEAHEPFVVAELGAGWAPWLVSVAAAARQRGIHRTVLIGIEGSKPHCDYAHTHFRDNGLDPDQHQLVHGVVGVKDGFALFPVLSNPDQDYGAAAVFKPHSPSPWARLKAAIKKVLGRPVAPLVAPTERVRCYSLPTLLAGQPRVDLLHVDIQGHEAEVITAAREVLRRQVRRMVIGTHGAEIEQQLRKDLSAQGWILEGDESCLYTTVGQTKVLCRDGCQVWANPGLAPASQAA